MKHSNGNHTPPSSHHHAHHDFDDPNAIAQRLDAPERDLWQKPEDVIASFQLSDDATVAEIGAGTGYFVIRLARQLTNGTVIGLDAQPQMVAYLRQRADDLGMSNVDARLVRQAEALPLTEKLDLLLCVDTYHHIADRVSLFSRYAKHLKRGGTLVVIDRAIDAPEGPPAELRLSTESVQDELSQAGFTLVADMDFLLPYQYYLAFSPIATS
ncbi:MAG TPA: class I SAM-dependent methyltransferase [Thermomicrobiales bacterium]|nr:class I SAM-dependent methyltransferase [Thermomicrobiales bacterium]